MVIPSFRILEALAALASPSTFSRQMGAILGSMFCFIHSPKEYIMTSMAPELRRDQYVSSKVDVYNFGCIVNEIMSEKKCFHDMPLFHDIWGEQERQYYLEHTPTINPNLPEGMFPFFLSFFLFRLS